MKVIRIIIGVLAALFALAHVAELPVFLERLETVPQDLRFSTWAGKFAAIVIGLAVSVTCFRKKKPPSESVKPTEMAKTE